MNAFTPVNKSPEKNNQLKGKNLFLSSLKATKNLELNSKFKIHYNINDSKNKEKQPKKVESTKLNNIFLLNRKDKINNISQIKDLELKLDDLEKKDIILSNDIDKLQKEEDDLNNNLNSKEEEEKLLQEELNNLKKVNEEKNKEYSDLINNQTNEENNTSQNNNSNIVNLVNHLLNIENGNINEDNNEEQENQVQDEQEEQNEEEEKDESFGPPMTFLQIDSLPIDKYPKKEVYDEHCVICGFDFYYNDSISKLEKCQHIFHKECIGNFLIQNQASKCPICKTSLI